MAKCHQNRRDGRKRSKSNSNYPDTMRRKLARKLQEMPNGITVATRSYGFAIYADVPQKRNGEICVQADTRLGGFERYEDAALYAHEHLSTSAWKLWQRFKPEPRRRQRR